MVKAMLEAERIGRAPMRTPFDEILGADTRDRSKPWVAEIRGFSAEHTYQRRFLAAHRDYSNANSKGTRGVFYHFTLESGWYYEVYYRTSWKGHERYFAKVDDGGEIVRVEEEEVREWLHEKTNTSRIR